MVRNAVKFDFLTSKLRVAGSSPAGIATKSLMF